MVKRTVSGRELNEQLAELRIRATALRADPNCTSTVAEVVWGHLYPRIVIQNHPAPGVTIHPGAIPVDHTLVLAAKRPPRPGRQPTIVMRIVLVRGSAPACIGEALSPPSPLVGFTALAREAVAQARQEAFDLRQLNVGPEHILLALLLGSEWVEPGHILLGLVGHPESSVVGMLRERARDPEQARAAVTRLLNRAPDPGGARAATCLPPTTQLQKGVARSSPDKSTSRKAFGRATETQRTALTGAPAIGRLRKSEERTPTSWRPTASSAGACSRTDRS